MKENSSQYLDDPSFQSLLVDCLEKLERGEDLDPDALQREHPEYAEPLQEFLDDRELLKQIAGDVRDSMVGPTRKTVPAREIEPTIGSNPPTNGYAAGDRIEYVGEYKILGEIARGGMGVVFKARQERLKRTVALKMILSGRLADDADIQRFQREAQAAAKLQHPNIVGIHEIGQHDGHHYFTMDLIEGQSLSESIREESLPPREAARIIKTCAAAIQAAHDQGTLHRDLKPANILLASDGEPKITDFGLAKVLDELDEESRSELTATGQILGTPSYMSPEQAEGKHSHIGPASDIYSLGAVLYACLTGRAPFVADSPVDTLLQVMREDPPSLRMLNPAIPKDLENICLKCLAKEPHKRYGTARELADDLSRFLEGRPVHARPVGNISKAVRWCRRNPVVASLLLLVALSLVSGTAIASYFAVEANNQLQVALAEKQRADDARADAVDARQEAIGAQHDAEDARDEAAQSAQIARQNETLAEQNADKAEQRRLEAEKERKRAQWQTYVARLQPIRQAWLEKEYGHLDRLLRESIPQVDEPDFRGWEWYYFQDQVNQVSESIGDHKKFTGHFAHDLVNGYVLAATSTGSWQLWDLKSNRLIDTLELKHCRPETVHFSPDGTKVAWGTWDCRLRVLDLSNQEILHDINAHPEDNGPRVYIGDVAWSPDGDHIASASRAGGVKVWNATSGDLLAKLQTANGKNSVLSLDWHPQSGLAAAVQYGTVRVWDVEQRKVSWSAQFSLQYPICIKWNPLGTRLAYGGNGAVVVFERGGKKIGNHSAV